MGKSLPPIHISNNQNIFIMRFVFLLFNILCFSSSYSQDTILSFKNHVVNQVLYKIKSDKDLKNASIGFIAKDIKTGEIISELNPDLSLMPASTQKIITTATALEVLGNNYRFSTTLQYSGKIDTINRLLKGNIYVKGGADPTLGSIHFDKTKKYEFLKIWAQSIQNLKINSIEGSIIGDASKYSNEIACPKWLWEDVGNYFGAGPNGLTVFDNLYELHLNSPSKTDSLTTLKFIDPEIPGLIIHNEVLSSNINADEAFIFGSPYQYLHEIRGTIPKNKEDFVIKGAIPDPAYFIAWKLNKDLRSFNIKTSNQINTVRNLKLKGDSINEKRSDLQTYYSPYLFEIVNITNKKSINLYAEHLLIEIGFAQEKSGTYNSGLKAIKDFWQARGMDTDGFYMYDGSGLSRSNAITPNQMVFILNYMKTRGRNFDAFYNSLPVAGKSGTLTSLGKNTSAEGAVHAKSGSIDRVRAYTGYVTTKSGRELTFCINISNYNCSDSECRNKLEQLIISLAEFNL